MTYPVLNAGPFEMAATEPAQEVRSVPGAAAGGAGGLLRQFFRMPLRKEPWLAAAYLLVQFPIAVAAFVYAVTMVSAGAGTIVLALAGLVLLAVFMYSLQPYGELQRWLSNGLLGTHIAPLPFENERGELWSMGRLKARVTNPMTWRIFVFLFVQFGLGIAGFVVATVMLALPVPFLTAPVSGAWGDEFWFVDTWQEGLFFVPLAVPVFFVAVGLLWGAGWVSGAINTLFLGTRDASIPDEGPTVIERARAAAGAWNNPGAPVVLDPGVESVAEPTAPERPAPASPAAETGLMVDVAMRRVRVNGRPVELTPKEFDLLALFAQNPGRPFSRDDLLDRIWRDDYEVTDRTIDTHVQRLRKKLGNQAGAIQTVWGVGYRFEAAVGAAPSGLATEEAEPHEPNAGW